MNATLATSALPGPTTSAAAKPLWAAIGVLSICVLAMGASLVHVNKRPIEPLAQAALPLSSAQAMNAPGAGSLSPTLSAVSEEKKAESPAESTPAAPKKIAKVAAKAPADHSATQASKGAAATPVVTPQSSSGPEQAVIAQAPAPAPVVVPTKPICGNCGTIEAVTPVTRDGKASGAGVVAGGVLGAVVGNQVGKGNGRAVATVLGAVGGGWAGNAIEKKMKKETVYSVRVRMEDGSTRTLEQASAPMVGAKVVVDGSALRPA